WFNELHSRFRIAGWRMKVCTNSGGARFRVMCLLVGEAQLVETARSPMAQVLSWAQVADHEDLVTKSLRHQSDRDALEGVPDEVINIRLREIELHDRNLTPALAQLNKVGAVQRDPRHNT